MKVLAWMFVSLVLVIVGCVIFRHLRSSRPSRPLAHGRTEFSFTVDGARDAVFPLFGASAERKWGTGANGHAWDPDFLWPLPERDVEGEVFTIRHGHKRAVTWINTAFEAATGHAQYAYFSPDSMVTRIDIHVAEMQPAKTQVNVVYEQTALDARQNASIMERARHAPDMAREWRQQVQAAVNQSAGNPSISSR